MPSLAHKTVKAKVPLKTKKAAATTETIAISGLFDDADQKMLLDKVPTQSYL